MASRGHDVIGIEPDQSILDCLNAGKATVFEPGLEELITEGLSTGKLQFATANIDLSDLEVLWVAFDTPVDENDQADIEYVNQHIKNILPKLSHGTLVLISSQMPVGSIKRLEIFAKQKLRRADIGFACYPENLRLGNAIKIFRTRQNCLRYYASKASWNFGQITWTHVRENRMDVSRRSPQK